LVVVVATIAAGCTTPKKPEKSEKPWSVRMAESVVAEHPDPSKWEIDERRQDPKWSYATSFATYAVTTVGLSTGDPKLTEYAKLYIDAFIDKDGKFTTATYKPETYKLDDILPGRLLLMLLKQTGEPRYRVAADTLAQQFANHPRTKDRGFWHKQIYEHQMWLDGIFMGCPFMAEYAQVTKDARWFDEAAHQIVTIANHTYDQRTGLYFHGWDESRKQQWANKQTGTSPHVWGRAVGWYVMGIVDTLERLPQNHPRRSEVLAIFRNLADAIAEAQDDRSGVWWQVMDQPGRQGNYLESSASAMFVYALMKGVRLGLLDEKHADVARRGHQGMIDRFIWADERGERIALTDTCQVAGLGGKPYRDGSFQYYISEPRIKNDPKGVAPFILASLEIERAKR
jgi:unsaturated rhamnogalacturonyl hydrolase